MKLLENILLAFSSLRAGKMRALLTMLGIIIGISSVIAIVTVGNSLTDSFNTAMADMGMNQVQAYVSTKERNVDRQMTDDDYMPMDWIMEFRDQYPEEIDSLVIWQQAGAGQIKKGKQYANVNVWGGPAFAVRNNGYDIIRGRDINDRDVLQYKNVGVISDNAAKNIFGRDNPIGKEVSVHTDTYGILSFTVVGVYHYEMPAMMSGFAGTEEDITTEITIPVTTAKRIAGAADGYDYFSARLAPGADAFKLTDAMQQFFDEKYKNNQYFQVYVQNNESWLNQMNQQLGMMTGVIGFVAFISLIVGGIGVMNIMLVSVTERTREIGTRKALGARSSAILSQFITESMIICLIGGMIGIVLGLLLGSAGSKALQTAMMGMENPVVRFSGVAILAAVLFSMVIGVFFGFYPAYKAAKLDPIEALRYE